MNNEQKRPNYRRHCYCKLPVGIAVSYSASPSETVNLDMGRTHGTISTAMGSPILGDTSAPITIVEFGDYQCHQCYNWFHNTKPAIVQDYIDTGKANLVFVDLAFLGRDSPKAAQASYCAEDQGMYWEYHDTLYNSSKNLKLMEVGQILKDSKLLHLV